MSHPAETKIQAKRVLRNLVKQKQQIRELYDATRIAEVKRHLLAAIQAVAARIERCEVEWNVTAGEAVAEARAWANAEKELAE